MFIYLYDFRQPWFHFDFLYNFTKDAKEFKKHSKFCHSISDDVIQKRKQTLVRFVPLLREHSLACSDGQMLMDITYIYILVMANICIYDFKH